VKEKTIKMYPCTSRFVNHALDIWQATLVIGDRDAIEFRLAAGLVGRWHIQDAVGIDVEGDHLDIKW